MQIKNSHKVITAIAFLVALMFLTAFKVKENVAQVPNTAGSQTKAGSHDIDIHILIMGDKVEALKKFITRWQEVRE